ncbi:MAG TPA: branched-chain amino acid ABC transporter permease [Gaiellaceae bacterium]|jgi:branched-chain amino acid transport system permease protein|nr:branched-chain amino acid ABC transporter permease [Gaiellaceae bacterium]
MATATAALQRVRGSSVIDAVGLLLLALVVVWIVVKFAEDPTRFLNVSIIGATNGAIYGLVALGYTLVYGILQLINFAHGDVFALSGLIASTMIISVFSLDADTAVLMVIVGLLGTLLVTVPAFAFINASIERIAYKPLRNAPRLAPLITAVGVSFIVQNVSLALYGVDFESVPNFIPRTDAFSIGDVAFQWDNIAVFLIVIPVLLVLTWFVRSTRQGKAMRAVSQDKEASAMMGIDVNRTISVTFFLAGGLAAVAGLVYLLQFNIRYDTGFELGLIAFTAAVLGGIGNLTGAVLGAMLIGMVQAWNEGLDGTPGGDWTRSIVFGILIAVLVFRPQGLLGERTPEGA